MTEINRGNDDDDDFSDIIDKFEAAKILKLHPVTVVKLSREKKIPSMKIANKFKYSKKALYAFIKQGCINSVQEGKKK
jgi:hypothetical protein